MRRQESLSDHVSVWILCKWSLFLYFHLVTLQYFLFRLTLHVSVQCYSEDPFDQIQINQTLFASSSSRGRINCVVAVAAHSVRGFIHYLSSTRGLRKVDMPQPDMIMKEIRDRCWRGVSEQPWMGFILISPPDPPFHATSCRPDKVDVALRQNVQCKQIKLIPLSVRWMDGSGHATDAQLDASTPLTFI